MLRRIFVPALAMLAIPHAAGAQTMAVTIPYPLKKAGGSPLITGMIVNGPGSPGAGKPNAGTTPWPIVFEFAVPSAPPPGAVADGIAWQDWAYVPARVLANKPLKTFSNNPTNTGFTVVARVRPATLPTEQTLFASSNILRGNVGLALQQRRGDNRFQVALLGPGVFDTVAVATADFVPSPDRTYEVAGVYDASVNRLQLYVNGTLRSVNRVHVPQPASRAPDTFTLTAPRYVFNGELSELRMVRQSLSAHQIANTYAVDTERFRTKDAGAAMVAAVNSTAAPKSFTYSNPIYFQGSGPHDSIHDPQILREGDRYYLVATLWPFRNYSDRTAGEPDLGSAPGIKIYSSQDLTHWKFEELAVEVVGPAG